MVKVSSTVLRDSQTSRRAQTESIGPQGPLLMKAVHGSGGRRLLSPGSRCQLRFSRAGSAASPALLWVDRLRMRACSSCRGLSLPKERQHRQPNEPRFAPKARTFWLDRPRTSHALGHSEREKGDKSN